MTKSHSDSTGRVPALLDVVVVGAGMFTRDVILPSLYCALVRFHCTVVSPVFGSNVTAATSSSSGSLTAALLNTGRFAPSCRAEGVTRAANPDCMASAPSRLQKV